MAEETTSREVTRENLVEFIVTQLAGDDVYGIGSDEPMLWKIAQYFGLDLDEIQRLRKEKVKAIEYDMSGEWDDEPKVWMAE